jgi:isopentenyldiphosphate isomerase
VNGGKEMIENFDILNELGEFTGEIATRDECHEKGLWHRAVYAFIIDKNLNILLQKRSSNKKLWPNKWDVTIGGHVNAGEFGRQALIRECKEELGIEITDDEIKYIVSTTSVYNKNNYVNNHYDECYLITKDINIEDLKLQKEEVSDAKYFSKEDLLNRINNNYEELTEKTVSWSILKKILESNVLEQINNK